MEASLCASSSPPRSALEHGLHVVSERPLAPDDPEAVADAERARRAREDSGEDAEDSSEDDSGEDDRDRRRTRRNAPAPPPPRQPPRLRRGRHNTGPKGVLADAAEACERARASAHAAAGGGWASAASEERGGEEGDLEAVFEAMFADPEFIKAQQHTYGSVSAAESAARATRVFGKLRRVGAFEFVDAVDSAAAAEAVIVQIFEPDSRPCRVLKDALAGLAQRYVHVQFLRLPLAELATLEQFRGFDEFALPALVVYEAGAVRHCFLRATDLWGRAFDEDRVEAFLLEQGVLVDPRVHPCGAGERGVQRSASQALPNDP